MSLSPKRLVRIFGVLARARRIISQDEAAVTVFDLGGHAVAWNGRPSRIPKDRLDGGRAIFVAQGALGLRLIAIEPIVVRSGGSRRVGTVGAELRLSPVDTAGADASLVETPLGPITLQRTFDDRATETPGRFVLRAPSGEPLLLATVPTGAPEETRGRWQRRVSSAALLVGGAAVLLVAASLLVGRRLERNPRGYARLTIVTLVLLVCVRAIVWWAVPPDTLATTSVRSWAVYASSLLPRLHRSPLDLMVSGLTLVAGVLVLVGPARASILARRGRRRPFPAGALESARALAVQFAGGRRGGRAAGRRAGRRGRYGREHLGRSAAADRDAVGAAEARAPRRPRAAADRGALGWRARLPAGARTLAARHPVGAAARRAPRCARWHRAVVAPRHVGASGDRRGGSPASHGGFPTHADRRGGRGSRLACVVHAPRRAVVPARYPGRAARTPVRGARRARLAALSLAGGCRRSRNPAAGRGPVRRRRPQPSQGAVLAPQRGAPAD